MFALSGQDAPAVAIPASTPWLGFALIALTLWSLASLIPRVLRADPEEERPRVRWRLAHVVAVVLVMIAAAFVARALLSGRSEGAATGTGGDTPVLERMEGLQLLHASAFILCVGAVCALALAFRAGAGDMRAFGLCSGRALSAPLRAIGAYLLCWPGILGVGVLWAWILGRFGVTEIEQPLVTLFSGLAPGERLVPVVLGVVVMPLCEEILFRGFLQALAVQMLGTGAGIVSTSLLFALLHGLSVFLPIFALSCLLGLVMARTQRLHAAWAVHALHNGLQFAVLFVDWEALQAAAPGCVLDWAGAVPCSIPAWIGGMR